MKIYELVLLAFALSMDAFAVSICKGLCMRKINFKHAFIIAMFFGVFQALMPSIGWVLGTGFEKYIVQYDHWIAFMLLLFIGGKMIYEALFGEEEPTVCSTEQVLDVKEVFILAIATSIDALAAGITFACLNVDIVNSVSLIGIITFAVCFFGVIVGNKFGTKYKKKAEILGGVVLVLIGTKILLEHLNIM